MSLHDPTHLLPEEARTFAKKPEIPAVHNNTSRGDLNTMTTRLPLAQRRTQLMRFAARLDQGDPSALPQLEPLIADAELIRSFTDAELKSLILIVKHHRPDLALVLLTQVRTIKERESLGACLASIWSRIDINAAWRAIASSSLPESERLALQSAMI